MIPDALRPREVSGNAVGEVRVVGDMHTRKVGHVPAWTVASLQELTVSELCCARAHCGSVLQAMMAAEADAFVALPGGFGTLEEIIEMITWQQVRRTSQPNVRSHPNEVRARDGQVELLRAVAQLGFHQKPVGFLNIADSKDGSGFYDHLLKFFDTCVHAVSSADAVAQVACHHARPA